MAGWSAVSVLDLAHRNREFFNDGDWIESSYITGSGNRLLQTGNIGIGRLIDRGTKRYVSDSSFTALKCKEVVPGDVLICRLADPAGRACVVTDIGERRLLTSVDVTIYRPDPAQADRRFLVFVFSTPEWFHKVSERCGGSTRTRIPRSELGKIEIELPSLEEQRLIADALADADNLAAQLERLIAKKQAIKHGIMQQLLAGNTRLPGFTSQWNEVRLGDVAQIKTGSRNNQDRDVRGRYPFYVRSATVERIDSYSYDCEAILVPGEGGIGSIFHYANGKFEVHQRVYKISHFDTRVVGKFAFYYLMQFFGRHAMENSVKATVDSLRLPTFANFRLRVPSEVEEQRGIVGVLTEADAELNALRCRLAKAKAITQGMMQEFFTGRTRLPVKGSTA
jgi:type I restriction enzyme, S subunit